MDAENCEALSAEIRAALAQLVNLKELNGDHKIRAKPLAGEGENSYGLILQVEVKATAEAEPLHCIVKIAPKNPARRSHMRVVDYYAREVFMYEVVFAAYRQLVHKHTAKKAANGATTAPCIDFMARMLDYSLKLGDEFIIFEDLTREGYVSNQRTQLPTYPMVATALDTLAKLHGLSLAMQSKQPELFETFVAKLQPDNLFTHDIEPVSIEFGKSYIRRARRMLQADLPAGEEEIRLQKFDEVERNFKAIGLHAVHGAGCAPYAVICHGDFWNNNILNRFEQSTNQVNAAKLIDFQMSRYASPILDLMHYLFNCTEQELRQQHFESLLFGVYYDSLTAQLRCFELDVKDIYPRSIFEEQLRNYGIYGLCMAAFSLPFFVAERNDLPDLDEVSEAIKDIGESKDDDKKEDEALKLIEEDFNLLTAKTAPHFKRRMIGIINDVVKYDMRVNHI